MNYNAGNIQKYQSKNPIKRMMVNRLNNRILKILEEELVDSKKEKIKLLDAGCGEGFISRLVKQNFPEVEITGLEYTTEAIEIAEKIDSEIRYIQGDITNMPFEDNSFSVVLCTEVLEHLENPQKAMKELVRVCKDGLLITVPNEPWFCIGNVFALKNITRFGNPIDHINHWTYNAFKKWVRSNSGFDFTFSCSFPWSMGWMKK